MSYVSSEIGRLRTVMVHRPGIEIARITPENKDALLFDDLLWLDRAQEEHDRFTAMMTDRDIEVLYFEDLLRDILDMGEIKGQIIDDIITPAQCGPRVAARLRETLREADCDRVVDVLLGGLLERELDELGIDPLFADLVADRFHYVLRPLPNLLFLRDNAAWVNNGLMLNVLATPARARESLYMREIYRHHPRFRDAAFPVWYGAGDGNMGFNVWLQESECQPDTNELPDTDIDCSGVNIPNKRLGLESWLGRVDWVDPTAP